MDGTLSNGYDIQIIVCIGDDNGRLGDVARLLNGSLAEGNQQLPLAHLIALLHMGAEVLAVQPDGVHTDVDQDLYAVRGNAIIRISRGATKPLTIFGMCLFVRSI